MPVDDLIGLVLQDLDAQGIDQPREEEARLLGLFIGELLRWSGRIHLTGRGRIKENLRAQILDSYLMLEAAEDAGIPGGGPEERGTEQAAAPAAADIGSGAGFPGIVWKIARPGIDMTLFERREKQLLFLQRMTRRLGMAGVRAIGGEVSARRPPGNFHVVLSKASGRFDLILPIAQTLLGHDGLYVTVKGLGWREELARTDAGGLELASHRNLPADRGVVVILKKTGYE